MRLLAAVLKILFATRFFSSVLLASSKRLDQQQLAKLLQVQTTRGTNPAVPSRSPSSASWESPPRIGHAVTSADKEAIAAVADNTLDEQRYEYLWQRDDNTNPPMPSEIGFNMDANNDGIVSLRELQHGNKELGSPASDAAIESFFNRADTNHDGKIDGEEMALARESWQIRKESAVAEGMTYAAEVDRLRQGNVDLHFDAFEQEAAKMIESLIARDIQESKARDPRRAAFMQKLQREGIKGFAASTVFLGFYIECETNEDIPSLLEQCIMDDMQLVLGQNFVGKPFLRIFVQMAFAKMQDLAQREKLKEEE